MDIKLNGMNQKFRPLVYVGGGIVLVLLFFAMCCTVVDSGEVGIRFAERAGLWWRRRNMQGMGILQPRYHQCVHLSYVYPA